MEAHTMRNPKELQSFGHLTTFNGHLTTLLIDYHYLYLVTRVVPLIIPRRTNGHPIKGNGHEWKR